jgi:hypothetical protein
MISQAVLQSPGETTRKKEPRVSNFLDNATPIYYPSINHISIHLSPLPVSPCLPLTPSLSLIHLQGNPNYRIEDKIYQHRKGRRKEKKKNQGYPFTTTFPIHAHLTIVLTTPLKINQTPTTLLPLPLLLLLLPRPSPKRIIILLRTKRRPRLSRELRRRQARILALQRLHLLLLLAVKERVIPRLRSLQPPHRARASGIDKSARRSVLRGEAHVAGVAEGVLTFAAGQEGVEARLVGVLGCGVLLLEGWRLLLLLSGRGGEVGDGVGALGEGVGGLLFLEAGEGGLFGGG